MKDYKDMTCLDAVKYIVVRFLNMISKIIGMKGVVLVATMWMIMKAYIPVEAVAYIWIVLMLTIVFGEKFLEAIQHIKK